MNNLQARKALQQKIIKWGDEKQKHHTMCNFRNSYQDECNCNYTLDILIRNQEWGKLCVCTDTPPYQECPEHNGY